MMIDTTPNEIRYRIRNPGNFDKKSFRRKKIDEDVSMIVACPRGKYKGGRCVTGMQTQAFRFDRRAYDMRKVKTWIKKNVK